MNKSDKLKTLCDVLNACLVPELIKEFDVTQIDSSIFKEFQEALSINLIRVFDLIQQNEFYLIDDEKEYIEIKYNFILLLCEQTASNTLYQINNKKLLNNLDILIEKYFGKLLYDKKIEEEVQNYYKEKLKPNIWKKYIGAAAGFYRYLEIHYSKNNNYIDSDFSRFVLSVGLLFKDFYDPYYKEIGINILFILMKHTKKTLLINMNIPSIIFKETFDEVSKLDTENGIETTWICLYESLILLHGSSKSDFSQWSEIDDFVKLLISEMALAKNSQIFLTQLKFIRKVAQFYSIKDENNFDMEVTDKLRSYYLNKNCLVMLRWAKELLEFYVRESQHLMRGSETSLIVLKEMHLTYLYCILPIEETILDHHLKIFLEKYSLILTKIVDFSSSVGKIKKEIKEFLKTFIYQTEKSESKEILELNRAFNTLINDECFI